MVYRRTGQHAPLVMNAIIDCLHHAPYSADTNHGSSLAMIDFLQHAYSQAGVTPDLVCSDAIAITLSTTLSDGTTIPYIVAGLAARRFTSRCRLR